MSLLDRRRFLGTTAAAMAGAAVGPAAASVTKSGRGRRALRRDASATENPSPGFYRFAVGDTEITVLSDGHAHFPLELLTVDMQSKEFLAFDVEPETREEYFRSRLVPSDHVPLQITPVLIDRGGQRVLVDTGFGSAEAVPPTAGRLGASLEAAGVPPESIDTVILTHAHPDSRSHAGAYLRRGGGGRQAAAPHRRRHRVHPRPFRASGMAPLRRHRS